MIESSRAGRRRIAVVGAVLATVFGAAACAPAGTLLDSAATRVGLVDPVAGSSGDEAERALDELARNARKYVVVDLDLNELRFMDGERVLWSGPVGTGTGLRLRGEDNEWDFSTPNGVFFVQYKEEDPVWILPDWYFVEHDLPIPPRDAAERRVPGGLGTAAVYLGDEIAIHGTDKPELLGQQVSHGCIRLADANAQRLFHNVQIGTPVVIVGSPRAIVTPVSTSPTGGTSASAGAGAEKNAGEDPLVRLSTQDLIERLDRQIEAADTSHAWTATASALIARGLEDDAVALRYVLRRAGQTNNASFESEYATFVADAYARGVLRAVVSLARIGDEERVRAARAIVRASMELYHGSPDDPTAPWPTRRVPSTRLGPDGTLGWTALREAEEEYRAAAPAARISLQSVNR